MTAQQKETITGTLKWIISIGIAAGGIAAMVRDNCERIDKHDVRLSSAEMRLERLSTKQEQILSGVTDMSLKQDQINQYIKDYLLKKRTD